MACLLPFFPTPRPDELLYSVFARYHTRSPNKKPAQTMGDLFGSSHVNPSPDLPASLGALCGRLHPDTLNTADRLVREHTLFPYFGPFLHVEQANRILAAMKGPLGGASRIRPTTITSGNVPFPPYLKLCPKCIEEDEAEDGEPYWHRSHQPFGVQVCPIHGAWLLESSVATHTARQSLVTLTRQVAEKARPFVLKGSIDEYHHIARAAKWLLDHQLPVHGLQQIHKRYLVYLDRAGLLEMNGSVNEESLVWIMIRHYPGEFLEELVSPVGFLKPDWLKPLIRQSRQVTHPLRHILLMHALGVEPEEFFADWDVKDVTVFGSPPWPCLNPAADHYGRPVVQAVKVTREPSHGHPVGKFECSCGFVYLRSGPDRNKRDEFHMDRVVSYGWVFKQKIRDLGLKGGKSTRQMAEILHVPEEEILRNLDSAIQGQYLDEIGLSLADEDRRDTDAADRFEKFRNCRNHLLELIEECPGLSRTEARRLASKEYTYLLRFDPRWLVEVLPKRPHTRTKEGVDWQDMDQELSSKAAATAIAIKEEISPSRRASKTAIAKALVIGPVSLAKLPLSEAALEAAAETVEQYQIRRVDRAAKRLKEKGEHLAPWKLIKEAGIPYRCSEKVTERVEWWCYR